MECEENDVEPACDDKDEPCAMRVIQLISENMLAWELYQVSRSPIADLLLRLYPLTNLGPFEQADLYSKLRIIELTVLELEEEERKRRELEMRRK